MVADIPNFSLVRTRCIQPLTFHANNNDGPWGNKKATTTAKGVLPTGAFPPALLYCPIFNIGNTLLALPFKKNLPLRDKSKLTSS